MKQDNPFAHYEHETGTLRTGIYREGELLKSWLVREKTIGDELAIRDIPEDDPIRGGRLLALQVSVDGLSVTAEELQSLPADDYQKISFARWHLEGLDDKQIEELYLDAMREDENEDEGEEPGRDEAGE